MLTKAKLSEQQFFIEYIDLYEKLSALCLFRNHSFIHLRFFIFRVFFIIYKFSKLFNLFMFRVSSKLNLYVLVLFTFDVKGHFYYFIVQLTEYKVLNNII